MRNSDEASDATMNREFHIMGDYAPLKVVVQGYY